MMGMESLYLVGWSDMQDESVAMELLRKKVRRPSTILEGAWEVDNIFATDPWDAAAVDNRSVGNKWFFSKSSWVSGRSGTKNGVWVQTGCLESLSDGAMEIAKRTFTHHSSSRPRAKFAEWTIVEYVSQFSVKKQKESVVLCCLSGPKTQYAMDSTSDFKSKNASFTPRASY